MGEISTTKDDGDNIDVLCLKDVHDSIIVEKKLSHILSMSLWNHATHLPSMDEVEVSLRPIKFVQQIVGRKRGNLLR